MTSAERTRDETLDLLRAHKAYMTERFGVVTLAVFGSTVRGEARPDSDIDILVQLTARQTGGATSECSPTSRTYLDGP